jgi:hypothetical protein
MAEPLLSPVSCPVNRHFPISYFFLSFHTSVENSPSGQERLATTVMRIKQAFTVLTTSFHFQSHFTYCTSTLPVLLFSSMKKVSSPILQGPSEADAPQACLHH